MQAEPPVVPEPWAAAVREAGAAEIGTLAQAQLVAAGVAQVSPAETTGGNLRSAFDELPEPDRARAIEAARADPGDPEVGRLVRAVTADPTFRGTWMKTPVWFEPLTRSQLVRLYGLDLPDGDPGVLAADVDLATARFAFAVRTLRAQARRLAAAFFAAEPPAPADAAGGWTDESGGGLAQVSVVWPHGRGTRALTWRVTRTATASPTAFLQARRDFGLRRSTDATVSEDDLAARLLEALELAAAEGFRRG